MHARDRDGTLPRSPQQLVHDAVRSTTLAAVADAMGVDQQELRGYQSGIALSAVSSCRLRDWCIRQLAPGETLVGETGRMASGSVPTIPQPNARRGRPPTDPTRTAGSKRRPNGLGMEQIRKLVVERAARSSIAAVAREIGPPVSRNVLYRFAEGADLRTRNARRLQAWYAAIVESPDEPSGERADPLPGTDRQWNSVPVHELREFYAAELNRVALRGVARGAGLWPQTLSSFLEGRAPGRRIRRLLALYYLQRGGVQTETPTRSFSFSAEQVRDYLRFRAELASIRSLAPSVGLCASTLHGFLRGTSLRRFAVCRLYAWYGRESPAIPPPGPDLDNVLNAVSTAQLVSFYKAHSERTPLQAFARRAGVHPGRIAEFLSPLVGERLDPHSRRELALYYLVHSRETVDAGSTA
jgi:hypothetical protein